MRSCMYRDARPHTPARPAPAASSSATPSAASAPRPRLAAARRSRPAPARPIRSPPSRRTSPAKAKSVIFLFMAGGPSHLETFDPKPLLNKLDGQTRPAEFGEAKYQFVQQRRQAARHASARSRSTARAASRSPTCSRTRPSASTTSPSSAPATATWSSTRRRSTSCSPAASCPGFPEHGLVGRLRPRLGERVAAGLRRDARSRRRARSGPADVHATASCRPSISRRCSAPATRPVRTSTCRRASSLDAAAEDGRADPRAERGDARPGRRGVRRPHRRLRPGVQDADRGAGGLRPLAARRRRRSTSTASASEPTRRLRPPLPAGAAAGRAGRAVRRASSPAAARATCSGTPTSDIEENHLRMAARDRQAGRRRCSRT